MCSMSVKIKAQKGYDHSIQKIMLHHTQQKEFLNHLIL